MNTMLKNFFNNMHKEEIRYCHWKSNNNLGLALSGVDDVDILVDYRRFTDFIAIISSFGFRQAEDRHGINNPFVFHYYGYDDVSGDIMHLHVYFRIVTGGSIFKNHVIPVEELFLSNLRPYKDIYIPDAEIDYALLVIRKMIEQSSIIEHYLFIHDLPNIHNEMDWLSKDINNDRLKEVIENNFPNLPYSVFQECVAAIRDKSQYWKRIRLGFAMSARFSGRAASWWTATRYRSIEFFLAIIRSRMPNLFSAKLHRVQLPGGIIVSFVGSEASGKSTLSGALYDELKKTYRVSRVHLGKPPRTFLSRFLWLGIRVLIKIKLIVTKPITLFKGETVVDKKNGTLLRGAYDPHPIIACLDAFDRNRALRNCVRLAMDGEIVITDRLPSSILGQIDGPKIQHTKNFYGYLGRLERAFYDSAATSDLIFRVGSSLEITLSRNTQREVTEPEDFVISRYEQFKQSVFPGVSIVDIDTSKAIDSCIKLIRQSFFGFYTGRSPAIKRD
jgi:hypothetical protein